MFNKFKLVELTRTNNLLFKTEFKKLSLKFLTTSKSIRI